MGLACEAFNDCQIIQPMAPCRETIGLGPFDSLAVSLQEGSFKIRRSVRPSSQKKKPQSGKNVQTGDGINERPNYGGVD